MNTHTTTTITYPMRKDTMEAYVSDHCPTLAPLAPFDFFHSEPSSTPILERVAADLPFSRHLSVV